MARALSADVEDLTLLNVQENSIVDMGAGAPDSLYLTSAGGIKKTSMLFTLTCDRGAAWLWRPEEVE